MPIRLPSPDAIRQRIAEEAAEISRQPAETFLELLGPVEPTEIADASAASWRLSYYQGSREQHAAIERAIAVVQRSEPLMRLP